MLKRLVLAAALLPSAVAQGAEAGLYTCQVSRGYTVNSGVLRPLALPATFEDMAFTVDRDNGEIRGSFDSGGWNGKREVLDRGSDVQSFKVLMTTMPFVHVQLLVIKEQNKTKLKDFILTRNSDTFTGTCKAAE